jgi:Na+:H+ antiporter, NhaA family
VRDIDAGTMTVFPTLRGTVETATRFFGRDVASGICLMVAAAGAVLWANVAGDSYGRLWQTPITVGVASVSLSKPLVLCINDGLMAVFFFLVGLEIKREVLSGELASVRKAALPIVAALGGMVVPAGIYAILNAGGPGARGWGIPMATDIAFALGALALLGGRVAPSLRVFLTAVAIADDIGAVTIIAIFYTDDLAWTPIGLGILLYVALMIVNRAGAASAAVYLLLGIALWLAVLKSGVHATIAGVMLAFVIPARSGRGCPRDHSRPEHSLVERLEHTLEPWVAFVILPLFALANAGVRLTAGLGASLLDPVALGILIGLFVGKQLGVAASCWLAVRLRVAPIPSGATWGQLYGVALLCGIGFTMSLFMATLALGVSDRLEAAKIGILAGSLASGVAGYLVLRRSGPPSITPRPAAARPRPRTRGAS